jgi:hypothetical protein
MLQDTQSLEDTSLCNEVLAFWCYPVMTVRHPHLIPGVLCSCIPHLIRPFILDVEYNRAWCYYTSITFVLWRTVQNRGEAST